jgi:predicted Zn-dependent peptidase
MAEFLKERLKNGLTILFERRNLPLTSVLIATRAGAIHETALKKGIAHFSEHMVFKATKTRNALELSSAIERVGGILNAFTADEMTAFWCKIPSKHFSKGMDVISDFVQNPKLDPKDIEAERKVILSEIAMYHDNPQWHIFNKIKELLYRKPFGMPITGSNETVAKINREDFLEWHQYYCPSNLVVSVVGSVKFDDVRDKLKCLGKAAQRFELPKPIVSRKSGNFTEKRAELDQTHFALAMHMPRLSEKARYAGELFNAILGEGMSSKLHNEIREKRGMAYRIHSYLEQEKSYGHAIIYA